MTLGYPPLVAAVTAEISNLGPIPFARFMELALYEPTHGYYMRSGEKAAGERIGGQPVGEDRIGLEPSGEDRIGWDGDFYTNSDVHSIYGGCLADQFVQIDRLLGRPNPFTIVEMGGGKGLLARDILARFAMVEPSILDRVAYLMVERSPAMQSAQREHLRPWLDQGVRVAWVASLDEMPPGSLTGIAFSNELVDAFPVHRVRLVRGEPKEVYVDYCEGRFMEVLGDLSTPELGAYVESLRARDLPLQDGQTLDLNLDALRWMGAVARVLRRGVVMTVDYGHTADDLFGADRRTGTLLCYYRQLVSEDPYVRVGQQDMTAHVDFTALATVGEQAGLAVTGFTNQMSFLMSLGVERHLESLEPGSREFQSVVQLLRPEGMGRTFKILIQHKGMDAPELDGLRFKPFFGSSLSRAIGNGHEAIGGAHSSRPSLVAHSPSPHIS